MRILVIDDEPKIRRGLEKLIGHIEKDARIDTAEDGLDALELLKTITPDLIFVDIKMPNMNGLDFIEEVRSVDKNIQFVIVSGYGEFEYAQKAIQYDVLGYILKPVMPAKVVEVIEKARYNIEQAHVVTENIEQLKMKYLDEMLHSESMGKEQLDEIIKKIELAQEYFVLVGTTDLDMATLKEKIQTLSKGHCKESCQYTLTQNRKKVIGVFTCDSMSVCNRHILNLIEKEALFSSFKVSEVVQDRYELKVSVEALLEQIESQDSKSEISFVIENVKRYIRNNYKEKLTLQDIADHVYLHPAYVSDLFKKKTGTNITDYILGLRIEESKKLLKNPEYKIYMIADEVGFNNEKYFSKVFKEATGMTPNQYRKQPQD